MCTFSVSFVIFKNYFFGYIDFTGFKKDDFLESKSTHVDFCSPNFYSNATPFVFLFFAFFHTSYTITIFLF